MYCIAPLTKKTSFLTFNYVFSEFEAFYNIAYSLTLPLEGTYNIAIKAKDVEDVKAFVKRESEFTHLNITIFMAEQQIKFMSMRNQNLVVKSSIKPFNQFRDLCKQKSLLFKKGVDLLVYNAIEHEDEDLIAAVDLLHEKFGSYNEITEKAIEPYFIINKIVYPRTVMLDFLWLSKWRYYKLSKCLSSISSDIVLNAIIKNLKLLIKEKAVYFKSGKTSNLCKSIDSRRLILMYRIFVVERGGLRDVELLFRLYERGLSTNDLIQEQSN